MKIITYKAHAELVSRRNKGTQIPRKQRRFYELKYYEYVTRVRTHWDYLSQKATMAVMQAVAMKVSASLS